VLQRCEFLRRVELLAPLTNEQVTKLADALESVTFQSDEYIIRQGDQVTDWKRLVSRKWLAEQQTNRCVCSIHFAGPCIVSRFKATSYIIRQGDQVTGEWCRLLSR
jgi:hypothetical protein